MNQSCFPFPRLGDSKLGQQAGKVLKPEVLFLEVGPSCVSGGRARPVLMAGEEQHLSMIFSCDAILFLHLPYFFLKKMVFHIFKHHWENILTQKLLRGCLLKSFSQARLKMCLGASIPLVCLPPYPQHIPPSISLLSWTFWEINKKYKGLQEMTFKMSSILENVSSFLKKLIYLDINFYSSHHYKYEVRNQFCIWG